MNEFVNWESLATHAGALAAVMLLTQFTKDLPFTKKLPTQIWTYILSLVVLYPAMYFTNQLNANTAILTLINGIVVSMAANGGYSIIQRFFGSVDGTLNVDRSDPEKDIYRFDVNSLDALDSKNRLTIDVKETILFKGQTPKM